MRISFDEELFGKAVNRLIPSIMDKEEFLIRTGISTGTYYRLREGKVSGLEIILSVCLVLELPLWQFVKNNGEDDEHGESLLAFRKTT